MLDADENGEDVLIKMKLGTSYEYTGTLKDYGGVAVNHRRSGL